MLNGSVAVVSPEKFCTSEIRGIMLDLNSRDELNRLVVDEVCLIAPTALVIH